MVEITLPIVLQIVQTTGILVGIIYYITIMRNTQRTREQALKAQEEAEKSRQREQIQLRIQSVDQAYLKAWTNVLTQKASTIEEWDNIFNPITDPELFNDMLYIQARYQSIGVMLKEKMIDPDLLYKIYTPNSIVTTWEHYRIKLLSRREEVGDPGMWREFEYLYEETKKRYPDITPTHVLIKYNP